MLEFRGDPYVTCVDLGTAGAVYTEGFARVEQARGEAAKAIKRTVNQELIYPPVDSREEILRAADHLSESRPPRPATTGPVAPRAQEVSGSGRKHGGEEKPNADR
jgi:hypothetical protein